MKRLLILIAASTLIFGLAAGEPQLGKSKGKGSPTKSQGGKKSPPSKESGPAPKKSAPAPKKSSPPRQAPRKSGGSKSQGRGAPTKSSGGQKTGPAPRRSGGSETGGSRTKPRLSTGGTGPRPVITGGRSRSGPTQRQTPRRSDIGQGRYRSRGDSYLSRAPSADAYLRRQRRTEVGPVFSRRTAPVPVETSHNLGTLPVKVRGLPTMPANGLNRRGTPGGRGSLSHQVGRMENYRVGDLRRGYYHYDRYWSDWHFGYGYYSYLPFSYGCVFSPYYWYWCVPGYITLGRVWYHLPSPIILVGGYLNYGYCGRGLYYADYYGYQRYDSYSSLDRALSDLVDAFRYTDADLLGKFLPRGGSVELFIDGEYAYTMSTDDYYDITSDVIYSVYTTNFEVEQVRRARGGEYRVAARHDFVDVSNDRQTVWMTFTLDYRGGNYVITQAGTSTFRPNL